MSERKTFRSIQRYLQEERAKTDPEYNEIHEWDKAEKRAILFGLKSFAAIAAVSALVITGAYKLAESQEQWREQYCPTHHANIACVETPTVQAPITVPDSSSPPPTNDRRR